MSIISDHLDDLVTRFLTYPDANAWIAHFTNCLNTAKHALVPGDRLNLVLNADIGPNTIQLNLKDIGVDCPEAIVQTRGRTTLDVYELLERDGYKIFRAHMRTPIPRLQPQSRAAINGNHVNGNHVNGNHVNGNHVNGNHVNGVNGQATTSSGAGQGQATGTAWARGVSVTVEFPLVANTMLRTVTDGQAVRGSG